MAGSNFIVRGGADFSGITKSLSKVQTQLSGFQDKISRSMKVIGGILGSLAVGKLIKDSTAMAMGVESAMGNIARNMSSSSIAFNAWAQTQAKAWGIARADAYKYGSTFSNLLASFSGSAQETADNTQELMQAAAIIASKTGRSYEDTAERIRSGMLGSTEAIEDLGVYTNISMIESTDAFKKFANGKSWAQLDFQVQQQIRLAAILEQTYARYGDTLADTTQSRQAQFIASLKNIQLNIGQAFLPIYNAVLPVLTALGNKLEEVTSKLKYFTQAIFGKAVVGPVAQAEEQAATVAGIGDAAEATGDKTAAAAKKAKGALAGFDELNTLTQSSDSSSESGATSGAGLLEEVPAELGEDVEVSPVFEKALTTIRDSLNTMKSYIDTSIASPFQAAVDMVKPKVEEFKAILAGVWADIGTLGQPLKTWFLSDFTPFLQTTIKSLGTVVSGLFDTFNRVFSDIWNVLVYPFLENFLDVGLPTVTDFATQAVEAFTVLFEEVKTIFDMLWSEGVKPALDILMEIWTDTVDSIATAWNTYGTPIFEEIKKVFMNIGSALRTVWTTMLKPIWDTFMQTIDWLWSEHLKPLLDNFLDLVGEFITGALQIINEFILPLVSAFMETFGPAIANVFQTAVCILGSFLGAAADVISGVITAIKGIVQFLTGVFTGDWGKAWEGIVNVFKGIFESIGGIVKGIINVVIDLINGMLRALETGLNWVIEKIDGLIAKVNSVAGAVGLPTFNPIGPITLGSIPKLASGAVIPPNSEFLAVLGDQRSGRNLEAPEGLIRQILREELAAMGGAQTDITVNFTGTMAQFVRALGPEITREERRRGTNLILGGGDS